MPWQCSPSTPTQACFTPATHLPLSRYPTPQMSATLQDIRAKNRQLAASNLAQQGAIAEARNQLAVVRSSEYQVGVKDVWKTSRLLEGILLLCALQACRASRISLL